MKRILCFALVCTATTLTAQTTSPWSGAWKLDRAKSHLTGGTYTASKGANGMWTVNVGPLTFTYATDGKPYPMLDKDHTLIATMVNPHTLKSIDQFKGKTTAVSTDILSADGNKISDVTVNTREDGSTYTTTETDTRTAPGEGFAGTWITTKTSSSSDLPETITASGDSLTFSDPADKFTLTVKLDGTPAVPVSPDMTAGVTVSCKKVSATRLEFTSTLNGKKISEGYAELSASGKSYSSVSWLVGKGSEKTTNFYVKQ
jgi:hypothetical protein